jgi:hypothetical protein
MDVGALSEQLEARLDRANQRAESATPGSPEWDAALANVDDIEHLLHALRPAPSVTGEHILSRLGPMVLEDDCLVHGTISALGPAGEALRVEIADIPARVHSRIEFLAALKGLAKVADFALEVEGNDLELTFYAWDPELHAAGGLPPP